MSPVVKLILPECHHTFKPSTPSSHLDNAFGRSKNCFRFGAILLIASSVISIILSFINLNNLLSTRIVDLASFQYSGSVGTLPSYCMDEGFLGFAWCCGILSFTALLTGIMAFGVEKKLNIFNLVFLFVCGFTAFISSIVILVCSSMVLQCHVTLTGLLPSSNLFVSIFAIVQFVLSTLAFFKVLKKRWEMISDLKYGVEPLPDPFALTINPKNIAYVQGGNPMVEDIDPFSKNEDFFKAMSKTGGHFNASYARSGDASNPTKYQLPNGAKQQVYQNQTPVSNVNRAVNSRIVGQGMQAAGRWAPSAGMGGGMAVVGRGDIVYPSSGAGVYVGNAINVSGAANAGYSNYLAPNSIMR